MSTAIPGIALVVLLLVVPLMLGLMVMIWDQLGRLSTFLLGWHGSMARRYNSV